jgi:alcohol oxidase
MTPSLPSSTEFDIIFAGGEVIPSFIVTISLIIALCAGGTAACVVAGRLAAYDSSLKILILEAGPHTLNKPGHVQPSQFFTNRAPTSTTVTVNIGNPSPCLNGRAPIVHSGHCVGGGSSVNCS